MRTSLHSILFLLLATRLGYGAEDYSIAVNSVGIGNNWRAGDITPIHVTVTSNKNEPVAAWVQWEVPDADGDMVLWGRPITLAPMRGTSTWLYAPTRGWDKPDTAWTVRLRELEDSKPTGELEVMQFSPQSVGAIFIETRMESFAVVGTRRLGLWGYLPSTPEVKQESAKVVSGLTSNDLPDAWPCYQSLGALVWADAKPELTFRQTEALHDWVSRGGHFILTLPSIGDPWAFTAQNAPLAAFTEGVQPELTTVPLSSFNSVLGRNLHWPKLDIPIHTFGNVDDAWDDHIVPTLWLEGGRVIAVQKTIGFGAVTIIGVDLTNGQLASLGLPETDVLWNRVLGKRNDTPTQNTIQQLKNADKLSPAIPKIVSLPAGKLIAQEIAMSSTASGKLGTVFLIVLSYWLIGGPVGYYILHRRKKLQWSWVLFVSSAVLFTFSAWVIAASTSGVPIQLKHVSVIDHVYGGNGQRVTGWFSLFLPQFGKTEISLQGELNNLLYPWTPPDASMSPDFIDKREVLMNVSHVPHSFDQPSRATTANFAFNWNGILEHDYYKSLIRISPDDPPTVVHDRGTAHPIQLIGSIINNTTAHLQDVTIIWVTHEQLPTSTLDEDETLDDSPTWISSNQSGQPLQKAYAWRVPKWKSGSHLQLDELYASNISSFTNATEDRYQIKDQFRANIISAKDWRKKMEMLSVYSHLTPPTYQKRAAARQGPESHHAIREGGRELDFAEWFSRPCIIVMGFLPRAPIPVSITSGGDEIIHSEGVSIVRWVYPLEQSQ